MNAFRTLAGRGLVLLLVLALLSVGCGSASMVPSRVASPARQRKRIRPATSCGASVSRQRPAVEAFASARKG